jgi:hypothetical protein
LKDYKDLENDWHMNARFRLAGSLTALLFSAGVICMAFSGAGMVSMARGLRLGFFELDFNIALGPTWFSIGLFALWIIPFRFTDFSRYGFGMGIAFAFAALLWSVVCGIHCGSTRAKHKAESGEAYSSDN